MESPIASMTSKSKKQAIRQEKEIKRMQLERKKSCYSCLQMI
jgi:predicted GIY-YIG superfamily endonuclease